MALFACVLRMPQSVGEKKRPSSSTADYPWPWCVCSPWLFITLKVLERCVLAEDVTLTLRFFARGSAGEDFAQEDYC